MPRYFTHYWRNTSVDAYILEHGKDALVQRVFGDHKLLGAQAGDYLYEVTVREGALYVLGRLEVKAVGRRTQNDPYPGQNTSNHQDYQADAVSPMRLMSDNRVPLPITRQIQCKTPGGLRELTFTADGLLDRQTLRAVRELTEASAMLLDSVIERQNHTR